MARNWMPLAAGAALAACCLVLGACEMSQPATSTSVALQAAKSPSARIPESTLSALGLEEKWYLPPAERSALDTGIESAFLLPGGLLVVSRPAAGEEERYVKWIRRDTGEALWYEKINAGIEYNPCTYVYPAGTGGEERPPELFFSLLDTVYCLDLRYGYRTWTAQLKFPISGPMVANETHLFLGSDNHRFYSVRKGATYDDWTHLTGGPIEGASALAGSKVVFSSTDGIVYGLDADQGWVNLESWTLETGARVVTDVVRFGRWVFVGSTDYKLYCLEAADGKVYWSFVAEAPIKTTPVAYSYRPNEDFVYCIATEDSRRKTRRTLFALPLPKGEFVPRGQALWRAEGVRKVVSLGRDTLYVTSDSGPAILGLDVRTGREKLRLPVEGFHFVPVNPADQGRDAAERGRIYLVGSGGEIQCVGERI